MEQMVQQVPVVMLENKEIQEILGQLVHRVTLALQATLVPRGILGLQDSLALRVTLETPDLLVLKEILGLQVPQVRRVSREQLVNLEEMELMEQMGPLVEQDLQDLQVPQALLEQQVLLALQEEQEPLEPQGKRELLDPLVHKETRVLQVLKVTLDLLALLDHKETLVRIACQM